MNAYFCLRRLEATLVYHIGFSIHLVISWLFEWTWIFHEQKSFMLKMINPTSTRFRTYVCISKTIFMTGGCNYSSNNFHVSININSCIHYIDAIMTTMASQITSLTVVYWIVYSDADQRKHQNFRVTGLRVGNSPGPVNSPHIGSVTRNMFPFDDVIMFLRDFIWDVAWHYNRDKKLSPTWKRVIWLSILVSGWLCL